MYLERNEFMRAIKIIGIYQKFSTLDNIEENLASAKIPLAEFKGEETAQKIRANLQSSEEVKEQ